jgi:hypothetical protein
MKAKVFSQPRDWREPFVSALDVYRTIIHSIRHLEFQLLKFKEIDLLAANCPRCFGPPVGDTKPEEPDYIVCMDGNFQHRRHAAASVPILGYQPKTPELFMPSDHFVDMTQDNPSNAADEEVVRRFVCFLCLFNRLELNVFKTYSQHPCSQQHTAANDVRGKSHWGGCDETGLFGMACRHDHTLKFINIVQSGEK